MADISQWARLLCTECQGDSFVKRLHLVTRSGAGTTESVAGWECAACRSIQDIGAMVEQQELAELQQQIKERQLQMKERQQVSKSLSSSPASLSVDATRS
jgi:hypothetical protein